MIGLLVGMAVLRLIQYLVGLSGREAALTNCVTYVFLPLFLFMIVSILTQISTTLEMYLQYSLVFPKYALS